VYNFGLTNVIFDKDTSQKDMLQSYLKASEVTAKLVLDQIGIEEFQADE
jgi:hypothetical protein